MTDGLETKGVYQLDPEQLIKGRILQQRRHEALRELGVSQEQIATVEQEAAEVGKQLANLKRMLRTARGARRALVIAAKRANAEQQNHAVLLRSLLGIPPERAINIDLDQGVLKEC